VAFSSGHTHAKISATPIPPGIIDTTEAKPMAANGMCQRRETGARIRPTVKQATKAPVAALDPSIVSAIYLRA